MGTVDKREYRELLEKKFIKIRLVGHRDDNSETDPLLALLGYDYSRSLNADEINALLIKLIIEKIPTHNGQKILLMAFRLLRGYEGDEIKNIGARRTLYIQETSFMNEKEKDEYRKCKDDDARKAVLMHASSRLEKQELTQIKKLVRAIATIPDISGYINAENEHFSKESHQAILPLLNHTVEKNHDDSTSSQKRPSIMNWINTHKAGSIGIFVAVIVGIILIRLTASSGAKKLINAPEISTLPTIVAPENALHNFLVAEQFYKSREPDKALPYLEKSLAEYIDLAGNMSIDVVRVYSSLGYTYLCMGDYAPALDNFNHALAIIDTYGDEYWEEAGRLYYNRCKAYHGLGDIDRANDDLAVALKIVTQHPLTQDILDYRFSIYLTEGKIKIDEGDPAALNALDDALLLKSAYDLKNQNKSKNHQLFSVFIYEYIPRLTRGVNFYFYDAELASILCNRAIAYLMLGDFEKSERDNALAETVLKKLPNAQQGMLPVCYSNFYLLAVADGDMPSALEYIASAIKHSEKWSGNNHPYTGLMYEYQGEAFHLLGKYDDALQSHLQAYKAFEATRKEPEMDYNKLKMEEIYSKELHVTSFDDWLATQLAGK